MCQFLVTLDHMFGLEMKRQRGVDLPPAGREGVGSGPTLCTLPPSDGLVICSTHVNPSRALSVVLEGVHSGFEAVFFVLNVFCPVLTVVKVSVDTSGSAGVIKCVVRNEGIVSCDAVA